MMRSKIKCWPGGPPIGDLRVTGPSERMAGFGKTPTALGVAVAILFTMAASVLFLADSRDAHASEGSTPAIEKTFDHATLIEHTISVNRGPYLAVLHLSQRREAEGSPVIASSNLAYQYRSEQGHPPMPASLFEAILGDLIRVLHERFGTDLALENLGSGGFMGVKEIEKRSVLAFADYEPWQRYLQDPQRFSQLEIYTLVKKRWEATGVFSPATAAFIPLGYAATFSGFEKLFVFPAGKCSFYPELASSGIRDSDRFPHPGSISFTLTPHQ